MTGRHFMDPDGAGNMREPTATDAVFLREGEHVGCEAGHVCWTARRNIHVRQVLTCDDLAPAPFQTTPKPGRRLGVCICGGVYVKALWDVGKPAGTPPSGAILALHIVGEGWRPVPRD